MRKKKNTATVERANKRSLRRGKTKSKVINRKSLTGGTKRHNVSIKILKTNQKFKTWNYCDMTWDPLALCSVVLLDELADKGGR